LKILEEYIETNLMQELFNKLVERSRKDGCKKVIWITGLKHKHDKIESVILLNNNFVRKDNIENWEAHPGHFVDDHYIWVKIYNFTS